MLFALVYAWLRLLLDLVDIRLRIHDPEAELLLFRHQLRCVRRQVKRPQVNAADRMIMAALSRLVNRAAFAGILAHNSTWATPGSDRPLALTNLCASHVQTRRLRSTGAGGGGGEAA